ncbi:MAG: bifunctional riboflavin kinase/FAD synthetase [Phycisphaerales bacterium]|nr:bifunctional riboflavin kinase/FAD synthetase [Phycisphaerales bacterium]
MKSVVGLEQISPPAGGCVLTVGNFDGVHRAHRRLLAVARDRARGLGLPMILLTFEPHPLAVVAPHRVPPRLTPLHEKLRLLEACGVDVTVVAESRASLLELSAEAFVERVLLASFAPRHMVEGPTFGFGQGRRGDNALLAGLGTKRGFTVEVVAPLYLEGPEGARELVSSSLARGALREGDVTRARAVLDRPYALFGTVVQGLRRGRELGFPTANLACEEQMIPGDGVFAGWAWCEGRCGAAAISIGSSPTFAGATGQVEAHLLDESRELYGKPIRLDFLARLRGQAAFDSPDALRQQIARDVETVRGICALEGPPSR